MSNIRLNFINKSADRNNSQVLIYQKNVDTTFDAINVAWKVIENCGRLCNHPFIYPMQFDVSFRDSYGNYSPLMTASDGDAYNVIKDASGDVLEKAPDPARSPFEVEVRNDLPRGAIDACIFRDGRLLATKTSVAPQQKAVFQFRPKIFIGVVSQVKEGDVLNSAIMQQANTELNLFGINSADIVMMGGGPGKDSAPFTFKLENINQG